MDGRNYGSWHVARLKEELRLRGAVVRGEKKDLLESTTEDERRQRVHHLQQRLQEDALRRKLRNVRLISGVERLAERASSLRELTDRLRLIKRQYEVLATHLPDDEPGDQSQHGEPVTSLCPSQSAVSVGGTQHQHLGGLGAGGGAVAAGASPLVEGYYDPRLAARGWQGAADPWGPASQQLGRDELGRSTEGRAALLRSRLATSLTVRPEPPPPPPPGGRGGNYGPSSRAGGAEGWSRERGPEWDRGVTHRDQSSISREQSEWERSGHQDHSELQDRSERDRSQAQDRSDTRDHSRWDRSSAPMRDRSVSEYSVSVPGRRRAAPTAWDGTLDGVASRWGTLERPTAADEQLQQLDSALARQRQLLAATAAAAGEQAGQQSDDHRMPLPRLRTGSWLNPEPRVRDQQYMETDQDPRSRDQQYRETDQDPRFRDGTAQLRDQDPHLRDHDPYLRDQDPRPRGREPSVRFQDSFDHGDQHWKAPDRDHGFLDRRSSQGHPSNDSESEADAYRRESEPRCTEHQALHEARQVRGDYHQEGRGERGRGGYLGGEGRRPGSVSEDAEFGAKESLGGDGRGGRMESGYGRDDSRRGEEAGRRDSVAGTTRGWGADRRGSVVDRGPGVRGQDTDSQESGRGRQESPEQELRRQESQRGREERRREEERRRVEEETRREDEKRQEEEERRRIEEERRREEEERRRRKDEEEERERREERQVLERKASAVSSASSDGGQGRTGRAASHQKTTAAATAAAVSRGQSGQNNGKQAARKKRNMGWLLEGGQSSGGSDDGRPGGSTGRPTGGAAQAGPSPEDQPTAAGRRSSQGGAAAAAGPVPAARRAADTSSSDEAAPAPARPAAPAPAAPVKLRLDSGSDSYHLSADLGGDDSDDDFWG